jgi:hypothetical protein
LDVGLEGGDEREGSFEIDRYVILFGVDFLSK